MTRRRDYGSGAVYRRTDGYWIAALELGWDSGRRRRRTFSGKTKADVVAKLRKAQRDLDAGASFGTDIPTTGEWLRRWLDDIAALRVAPRTLASHRSYVDRHLIPHIGRHRLDKLTPAHIVALHQTLRNQPKARGQGTLEESTVLRAHAVLSRALRDAMRMGYITRNPAQMVDRPSAGHYQPEFLDVAQAATLLRAVIDDPHGSRWAFGLLTGQRQGECLGLRWSHVDLDNGLADIAWSLTRVPYEHGCDPPCGRRHGGDCPYRRLAVRPSREHVVLDGALCLTRPKGGQRKVVPLTGALTAWLGRHREQHPPGKHDLVWSRNGGRPVDLREDYEEWRQLLARLDLPAVTVHSARHTCVSLLLSLGVPENVIMQMVGHSTVAAARRYQHVDQATAHDAAARLGRLLELEP
jgi:integrase